MNAKMRDVAIGILSSTIMILIGYQLNDYLARDRISIELVDFQPEMRGFPYRTPEFQQLMRNNVFEGWLQFSKGKDQLEVFDQEHTDTLSASETGDLVVTLKQFLEFDQKHLEVLKKLAARMTTASNNADQLALIKEARSAFLFESVEYYPDDLKTWTKNTSKRITTAEEAKELASNALTCAQEFKSARTGGLWLSVTFLNSGNTDGLIRSGGGNLRLAGRTEQIPIVLDDESGPGVSKRTIIAKYFRVDEGAASAAQLQTFRTLVQQGGNLSGTVTVKDFRNKTIHSGTFAFPVGA